MEKALKKYQEVYAKCNSNLEEAKAEQKRLEEEIQAIKTGVKENAKKGKFTSLLKGKQTDKLAKLLASKQIIDLEVEAIEENNKNNNNNDVVAAALEYIAAVEKNNESIKEFYRQEREKAEKELERAKEICKKYNVFSQIAETNRQERIAQGNLNGVLKDRITDADKSRLIGSDSLSVVKEILTR